MPGDISRWHWKSGAALVRWIGFDQLRQRAAARLGSLRHLPALFKIAWSTSPGLTAASVALRLLRAALPMLSLFIAKLLVDAVIAGRGEGVSSLELTHALDPHLQTIGLLVCCELGVAIAGDLLGRATNLIDGVLAELTGYATTVRLMEHAATLDLEQYEDATVQDKLERARRQVAWRSNLIGRVLGRAQDAVTAVSLAVSVVAFLPWMMGLLALALIPAFLNELRFNRQDYRLAYTRSPERREIDYLRYLGTDVRSAKELKLFGLNGYLVECFRSVSERMLDENSALSVRRAAWGGAFASLGTVAYYAAYLMIVWRTISGAITVGELTFLTGAFSRLRGLIEGLLLGASQLLGQAQYLDDLFSFLSLTPLIRSSGAAVAIPVPIKQGFVLEDVGYRYPGQERWPVRHLSLSIPAGEVIALVGENGAGKTTIVKLLARLYEPTEGRIFLDGRDLRDYDLDDLRARIGVIFQDFVRFDFTARDNIAVGCIQARDDTDRIEGAASRSLADSVVSRLPAGYGQRLGRRFDDSVDLSGGEWQKIAIGRAYMRDAEVLIFDEPTAALDARAEAEVFQRFGDLAGGRTCILISHRFSTVRLAHRIIVLENGRVLEAGSHADLVAARGRYAELFELQAAAYR